MFDGLTSDAMTILFIIISCFEMLLACITYRAGLTWYGLAIFVSALTGQVLHTLSSTGLGFLALFAGLAFILSSMQVINKYKMLD